MSNFNLENYSSGEKRKVLFVVPPQNIEEYYGRLASVGARLPWMGMAYVIGAVQAVGHEVKLVDCEAESVGFDELKEIIKDFSPDVICASAVITNVDRCLRTMQIAKDISSDVITVLGGPQVTIFPEQVIAEKSVDIIVIGEGEITVCEILLYLNNKDKLENIQGIWFRKNGNIVKNQGKELIEDMDSIPFPALGMYNMDNYYPAAYIWGKKVLPMLSARGCAFECRFCEARLTFQRKFRFHSADRVVSEINNLIDVHRADSFQFMDDIFTLNKNRAYELCSKIIENGRKFKWSCFTRTDCIEPELLSRMKEAGCYLICFGCESGDQKLLDLLNKKLTIEKNCEGIKMTKKAGIRAFSTFMLGLPTETEEMTMKTIDFAVKSSLDYAIFPILEPYPGTEIYEDALKMGYFINEDGKKVVPNCKDKKIWVPDGRERKEIERKGYIAMKKFYLRPHIICSLVIGMLRNLPLKRLVRLFYNGISYFIIARFKKVKYGTRY